MDVVPNAVITNHPRTQQIPTKIGFWGPRTSKSEVVKWSKNKVEKDQNVSYEGGNLYDVLTFRAAGQAQATCTQNRD